MNKLLLFLRAPRLMSERRFAKAGKDPILVTDS
jgi:hypothetical protein